MSKPKYVSYVVGTFLSFPIRVYHLLPETDVAENKEEQKSQLPHQTPNQKDTSQASNKRTCGHSQKSVRVEHSKNRR